MVIIHGTQKLLNRLPGSACSGSVSAVEPMHNWYATAWFWRPQLVLLVHETTLFPVVMPLAPAQSLGARMAEWVELTLRMAGLDAAQVDLAVELLRGQPVQLAKTSNRSVVSVMSQWSFDAEASRRYHNITDPVVLALRLADTPTSPLYKSHVFPRAAMQALLQSL